MLVNFQPPRHPISFAHSTPSGCQDTVIFPTITECADKLQCAPNARRPTRDQAQLFGFQAVVPSSLPETAIVVLRPLRLLGFKPQHAERLVLIVKVRGLNFLGKALCFELPSLYRHRLCQTWLQQTGPRSGCRDLMQTAARRLSRASATILLRLRVKQKFRIVRMPMR